MFTIREDVMNTIAARKLLATLAAATALSLPEPCRAATNSMPWDPTLFALQEVLMGYLAPAAIALAFSSAVILYALGGHDKDAGRLAGSGIGGCIALAIVYLLNYLLP
jgi:type IV secretory pathway VirB2 component (pilin)